MHGHEHLTAGSSQGRDPGFRQPRRPTRVVPCDYVVITRHLDEWAYLWPYTSNTERTEALADFLHTYNHRRCHTALDGHPPISRVNNAAGQYT